MKFRWADRREFLFVVKRINFLYKLDSNLLLNNLWCFERNACMSALCMSDRANVVTQVISNVPNNFFFSFLIMPIISISGLLKPGIGADHHVKMIKVSAIFWSETSEPTMSLACKHTIICSIMSLCVIIIIIYGILIVSLSTFNDSWLCQWD